MGKLLKITDPIVIRVPFKLLEKVLYFTFIWKYILFIFYLMLINLNSRVGPKLCVLICKCKNCYIFHATFQTYNNSSQLVLHCLFTYFIFKLHHQIFKIRNDILFIHNDSGCCIHNESYCDHLPPLQGKKVTLFVSQILK